MNLPLRSVAEMLGLAVQSDAVVTGWSVDSRTLEPGELFFALRGPVHDGHDYIHRAFERGAVAVVAEQVCAEMALVVKDTLAALQLLAARVRRRWNGDVVAVTGSAGKTTTKDVIADMLSAGVSTTKSVGNLNNHVGVPLSLLRLDEGARVAVIEMGMNHAGEIRELAAIAEPNVGVVTNVGYAHIENFESIDGIASAKRELIEALPTYGAAVLNADDQRVAAFAKGLAGRTVLYGLSAEADVRAEDVEYLPSGARFRVGSTKFESPLPGRHNVSNVLAGIAVAGLYGISPDAVRDKVSSLKPGKMRGERFEHRGVVVYNDCYNSNPGAARAMLDVLRNTPATKRIAVLGEMLELGRFSEALHRDVGICAAENRIDVLVAIHGAASACIAGAKSAGMPDDAAFFFEDPLEAGRWVRKLARSGDAILFKGSRGIHVERALEQFLATEDGSEN